MSSSSNTGSNQTKFANSNLNNVFSKPAAAGAATAGGTAFNKFSGMLVLKRPTGGASRAAAGGKLSVPKPVNLPSIKKEHAGNDPSTQLIPANATGGWIKSEPEPVAPPPEVVARLTAGSTWATSKGPIPGGGPVVAWQPPPPTLPPPSQPVRGPSFPADRHLSLNPEEYPSLAATKTGAPPVVKLGPRAAYDPQQDDRAWADDERAPPGAHRADWARDGDRPDEERFADRHDSRGGDARPQWDSRERSAAPGASQYDSYPARSTGGGAHDEQMDYNRSAPARGYPGGSYNSYDSAAGRSRSDAPPPPPGAVRGRPNYEQQPYERYSDRHDAPPMPPRYGPYDPYEDRSLFPPAPPRGPPPSRSQGQYGEQRGQYPGGAGPNHAAAQEEEDDPERQAFEAEVRRLAAELARKKRDANAEKREAIMEKRALASSTGVEGEEEESGEPKAQSEETEAHKPDAASLAAKALAMTQRLAQREIDLQENERQRKAAASEKLRQLDEQIAARSAAAAAVQAALQVATQQLQAQQQAALEEAAQMKAAAAAAVEAAAQKQALPTPALAPTQLAAPPGLAQHSSAQHPRPSTASQQQQRQAPQQLQQLQHTQQPAAVRAPAPAPHGWARPPAIAETAAPVAAPAMFGSFDTGLLHEIRSAPPPPPSMATVPVNAVNAADASPKTWRPVDGPAPAPIAPAQPAVVQQRVEPHIQHNKERTAGLWNDAGARDSARDAADASIAEKRATQAAGRGRGARNEPGGRGGRGGRGSAPIAQAALHNDSNIDASPPAAATTDAPSSAVAPTAVPVVSAEAVRARNVRTNLPRNERNTGEDRQQGPERGERPSARGGRGEGRGRGGRGGRGGHEEGSDGQWAASNPSAPAVTTAEGVAAAPATSAAIAAAAQAAVEQLPQQRVPRERRDRGPGATADANSNQNAAASEGRPASGQPATRRERDTREPRRAPPPPSAAATAVAAPPLVVPFTVVVGVVGEPAVAAVQREVRGETRPRGPTRGGVVADRPPVTAIAAAAAAVAAAKAALPAKLPSSGGISTNGNATAPSLAHRINSAPPSAHPATATPPSSTPAAFISSPLPPAPIQAWGAIGSATGSAAGVLRPVANTVLSLNDPITSEPPVVAPHLPHSLAQPKSMVQQPMNASPHPIGPPSIFDRSVGPRTQSANQQHHTVSSHDVRPSAAALAAIAASEAVASKSAAMIAAAAAAVAVSDLHEPNSLHLPMDLNPEVHLMAAAGMLPKQQQQAQDMNAVPPRHLMQQQGVSRPAYGFAPQQQQIEQHGNGSSGLNEQQRQLLSLNNPWESESNRHLVHLLPPQQQPQHMQAGEAQGSYYNTVAAQPFHAPPAAHHAPPLSPSLLGNLHQAPVFQNAAVPAVNSFDLQGGSSNGHGGHPSDLGQFSAGGPPSRPYTQGLNQFGTFNIPYFNQQPAPFMPTNKMPDWSTTARLSTAAPIAGPPGLTGLNSAGLLHGGIPGAQAGPEGFVAAGSSALNLNAAFSGGHSSPTLQQGLLSPPPNQNQQHMQASPMQGVGKVGSNAPVPYSSQIQQQYQAHPAPSPHHQHLQQQHQQQRVTSHTELPEDPFVAEPAKPLSRPLQQQQHNKGAGGMASGNHIPGNNAALLPPPPPPGGAAIRGQLQHNNLAGMQQHQALGLKGGPPIVSGAMMHTANANVGSMHAGGMMMDPLHGVPMMQHQGQQQHMQVHGMQQMQHNNLNHFGSHQQHQGVQMQQLPQQQPMQHQQHPGSGGVPPQHNQAVRGNQAGRGPSGPRGGNNSSSSNHMSAARTAGPIHNQGLVLQPLPEHNPQSTVYMGEPSHNHNQGAVLQPPQLSGGRGGAPGPTSNGPAGRGGGRMAAGRSGAGRGAGGQQLELNHAGSVPVGQNARLATAPHHAPQGAVAMPTMGAQAPPGPQRQQQGPSNENGTPRGRGPARSGAGGGPGPAAANGNATPSTGPGPVAGGRGGGRGQANRGPAPNAKGGPALTRSSGPTTPAGTV